MLEQALTYLERGFSVIPLHSPREGGCSCGRADCNAVGKHPRIRWDIYKERRATREELEDWWSRWPDANIGIVTGVVSGLAVLDQDGPTAGQSVPRTPAVRTGGGGIHYYFRHPGHRVKGIVRLATNLDIRGDGNQVVAAPSLHTSGRTYQWLVGLDEPLADLPEWIIEALERHETEQPARITGDEIPQGDRNGALTRMAGALRRFGATEEGILAALQAENRLRCRPPLSDREVLVIARSVARYAPDDGRLQHGLVLQEPQSFWYRDLALGELEPVRWSVEGLVPREGITVWGGDSGVGKSWIILSLAQAVAAGAPFLGRFETEQGRVLVVDYESGDRLLKRRIHKLHRGLGDGAPEDLPMMVLTAGVRLDRHADELTDFIQRHGFTLCIIDPLVNAHDGDENDSATMARLFERVHRLRRDTDCAFLFTHHIRKLSANGSNDAGQLLRGASAIKGAIDSYIYGRRLETGRIQCEHNKSRQAEPVDNFVVEIRDITEDATTVTYAGELAQQLGERLDVALQVLLQLLDDGPILRQDMMTRAADQGIAERTMRRAIDEARSRGLIVVEQVEGRRMMIRLNEGGEQDPA